MTESFDNITVRGIAAAVPSGVEENALAAGILGERRCKKQIRLTGIERRHVSENGQAMSDLCYPVAKKLMEHLDWEPESIRVLVLVTQCPNYQAPSTAFLLHKLLGLSRDCIAFDVNLGCSAFNAGIEIVSALLQRFPGTARGICLQGDLAGRCIKEGVDADVLAGAILFGSAGSGVAIEKDEPLAAIPIPLQTMSDGQHYRAILKAAQKDVSLQMDGEAVLTFSITDVVEEVIAFRNRFHLAEDDVDFYAFHQAQKMILDSIISSCGIDPNKELRSLREYGNTSGASIPLSLCANRDKFEDRENVRILSCGFGVGLTCSTSYFQIPSKDILPLIISDELYEK